MRKQAGQSAPDQRWFADRQPECRVEDISSDSNHSPETGGVFQFSIAKNSGQKKPFQSSSHQNKSPVGCCCCTATSNGRKAGRQVPVSRISSKPTQLRVKTNLISSIRPRRRSRLAIRQWSQHWRAIQSLKRYCSVLERRRGSDYNNLSLKAATCRRFKVEDETELESQTLKGEKGRKRERWRGCDSNASVCLILVPF